MKTAVIDSLERISVSGNAGSTPELAAISGDNPARISKSMGALEQMLLSLSLDKETVNALMNIGSDILTDGGEDGFRRGFRVAMRLMMESLGDLAYPAPHAGSDNSWMKKFIQARGNEEVPE